MKLGVGHSDSDRNIEEIVGYLNFSDGTPNPAFLRSLNSLFGQLETTDAGSKTVAAAAESVVVWRKLADRLRAALETLPATNAAFHRLDQAEAVLHLVFDETLPAYRRFHRDLLFHQTETTLFRPLFVGRMCEAVLREGKPWNQTDRIASGAITRLNDFVGHRPVAVLRTGRKLQPYDHERVRPIPLWIRDVGAAVGPYRELIEAAIGILSRTDPDLLARAWFDFALLDELAVDPRAYDFDHPAHRRPNYQFGQWDPHHIDNRGYYRRYVLQQVTLDGILDRIAHRGRLGRGEALFEAAAVLAGVILMGSGVSGDGPDRHDSSTTLATLITRIADYRDDFYAQLLAGLSGKRRQRLTAEADRLRQPLGGARQHLNQFLAARRASQLQHVHLAQLFARMGYTEAAVAQAHVVPVASARMQCEIDCRTTAAHQSIDKGDFETAERRLAEIEDYLHRAIECGAMIDPWNLLGFDAFFSLFPAMENSCHDHRADELLDLVDEIFALYARLQKAAAAAGRNDARERLATAMDRLAEWWDQFATTEVSSVEGISGREAAESAAHVAAVLGLWHEAGTAAGDVAFWRKHVDQFQSPKACYLVIDALLDQNDLVAAMALLMQWLGESDRIALAEGKYSFHELALRWMRLLWARPGVESEKDWATTRKFMDYLEAGGEALWTVPRLELLALSGGDALEEEDSEDADEGGGLYGAAYENVVYRDSTDDGFQGEVFESAGTADDFELTPEAERISQRLAFLRMLARLWRAAARAAAPLPDALRAAPLSRWLQQAEQNRQGLLTLLAAVHRYPIAAPTAGDDALVEYDHRQSVKEMLVERIIVTTIETVDAIRMTRAIGGDGLAPAEGLSWESCVWRILRAGYRGQPRQIRQLWPQLLDDLAGQTFLYLPLARGGAPARLIAARSLHRAIEDLLVLLPRLGLLTEACQLIAIVQRMEREHAVGPGGVTEFDRVFSAGYKAIVQCLVAAARRRSDAKLIDCLEEVTEPLVRLWLHHCRGVRFSPLEAVHDEEPWLDLKHFIQTYGHGLFTQHFMSYGNLRAILYQGVDAYLRWLEENSDDDEDERLLADLGRRLPRARAIAVIGVTIESVLDNYNEYMDYNSTTTQSDRGEMLYTLLDFLRLTSSYDRVAWNLQPLVLAHEVMIRSDRIGAASLWRETFAEQTAPLADDHLRQFRRLAREYGMQLRSVADRLGERFVRSLDVDRLRALVGPAIQDARSGRTSDAFRQLLDGIHRLTNEPSGAGFSVPEWLESLEEEADRHRTDGHGDDADEPADEPISLHPLAISLGEARRQILDWAAELDFLD